MDSGILSPFDALKVDGKHRLIALEGFHMSLDLDGNPVALGVGSHGIRPQSSASDDAGRVNFRVEPASSLTARGESGFAGRSATQTLRGRPPPGKPQQRLNRAFAVEGGKRRWEIPQGNSKFPGRFPSSKKEKARFQGLDVLTAIFFGLPPSLPLLFAAAALAGVAALPPLAPI